MREPLSTMAAMINRDDVLIIFAISMALLILDRVHALEAIR